MTSSVHELGNDNGTIENPCEICNQGNSESALDNSAYHTANIEKYLSEMDTDANLTLNYADMSTDSYVIVSPVRRNLNSSASLGGVDIQDENITSTAIKSCSSHRVGVYDFSLLKLLSNLFNPVTVASAVTTVSICG